MADVKQLHAVRRKPRVADRGFSEIEKDQYDVNRQQKCQSENGHALCSIAAALPTAFFLNRFRMMERVFS
jgi:hypothetical protein